MLRLLFIRHSQVPADSTAARLLQITHASLAFLRCAGDRELSHAKHDLYVQLTRGRKLEEKVEMLQSLHTHAADTESQLAAKIAEADLLAKELRAASEQMAPIRTQIRELELLLAQANAKLEAQEQIGEQLRAYLDSIAVTAVAPEVGK